MVGLPGGRGIGRSAITSRKIRRKGFPLGKAGYRAGVKWSFPESVNMVEVMSSEWARRTEEVGFGITSIGVTVEEKRLFVV